MTKKRKKRCSCKGRSGEFKEPYPTRRIAATKAIRRGGVFRTYPCPELKGRWHVTHG